MMSCRGSLPRRLSSLARGRPSSRPRSRRPGQTTITSRGGIKNAARPSLALNTVTPARMMNTKSSKYATWRERKTALATAVATATTAAVVLYATGQATTTKGRGHPAMMDPTMAINQSPVTDFYEIGPLLGEGGYGSVHMATRKTRHRSGSDPREASTAAMEMSSGTGEGDAPAASGAGTAAGDGCVAIKTVDKATMDRDEFMHEISALKAIHDAGGHPHIAGMEEMFEDEEHYYLVLELVSGGELFEHLIRNGAYSEQTAASILGDLAKALRFLHRRGIVHADLKPENLMLSSWDDASAKVKLVDFGCSCGSGLGFQEMAGEEDLHGTPAYWPPELVEAHDEDTFYRFNTAADMWAMGVIMFIMLVGAHPFDLRGGTSDENILRRVVLSEAPLGGRATAHLSASAVDLMRRLMEKDPSKRITADAMLQHPWTTGELASWTVIEGMDEKLAAFQEVLKSNLESGLFAMLVQQSLRSRGKSDTPPNARTASEARTSVEEAVGVIRQAFASFDKEGKGFVDAKDISRVLMESGEDVMSEEEALELDEAVANAQGGRKGVSMESFEQMMSSLETVVFQRGDIVFAEGDDVDSSPYMYILGSGKIDLLKQVHEGAPPARLTSLSNGAIFGESAMIHGGARTATVRCATPVEAVRIGKDSFGRMMKGSKAASANLREMSILRDVNRAKSLLKAVGNISQSRVPVGQAIVTQGEVGNSMYTVVEGNLDVRMKRGGAADSSEYGGRIASLSVGDVFGEMALMLKQPRSASVVCASPSSKGGAQGEDEGGCCVVKEIMGEDFLRMLKHSEGFLDSMKVILRTRMFRRAMLRLSSAGTGALSKEKMRAAFNVVDMDKSGALSVRELREALRHVESDLTEEDVTALMGLADLDGDGSICFEEFCRILRWEEAARDEAPDDTLG